MKNNAPKMLFNEQALPLILEIFGKTINDDGLIIDMNTGEPILTPEGEFLTKEKFGGIKKGSEIFLKDDLLTVINLAEDRY
jgi:hypothetical protein